MKLSLILENLQLVKFKYSKTNSRPKVKVLDFEYPGMKFQKTYGERKDLLGFNLNYFKNKRIASKTIDKIDSEARKLSNSKKEKYKRLAYFYPEVLKHIRRYNRKHITGLKGKNKIFYKKTTYNKLISKDNKSKW